MPENDTSCLASADLSLLRECSCIKVGRNHPLQDLPVISDSRPPFCPALTSKAFHIHCSGGSDDDTDSIFSVAPDVPESLESQAPCCPVFLQRALRCLRVFRPRFSRDRQALSALDGYLHARYRTVVSASGCQGHTDGAVLQGRGSGQNTERHRYRGITASQLHPTPRQNQALRCTTQTEP